MTRWRRASTLNAAARVPRRIHTRLNQAHMPPRAIRKRLGFDFGNVEFKVPRADSDCHAPPHDNFPFATRFVSATFRVPKAEMVC